MYLHLSLSLYYLTTIAFLNAYSLLLRHVQDNHEGHDDRRKDDMPCTILNRILDIYY